MTSSTLIPGFNALNKALFAYSSDENPDKTLDPKLSEKVTAQLRLFEKLFPGFNEKSRLMKVLRRFHRNETSGVGNLIEGLSLKIFGGALSSPGLKFESIILANLVNQDIIKNHLDESYQKNVSKFAKELEILMGYVALGFIKDDVLFQIFSNYSPTGSTLLSDKRMTSHGLSLCAFTLPLIDFLFCSDPEFLKLLFSVCDSEGSAPLNNLEVFELILPKFDALVEISKDLKEQIQKMKSIKNSKKMSAKEDELKESIDKNLRIVAAFLSITDVDGYTPLFFPDHVELALPLIEKISEFSPLLVKRLLSVSINSEDVFKRTPLDNLIICELVNPLLKKIEFDTLFQTQVTEG